MNETLERLLDLYAGEELDEETLNRLLEAVKADPSLLAQAKDLRKLVEHLHSDPGPEFTEETSTRILLQMQMRGATLGTADPSPEYQWPLPL
ncbi:MAG: hypothetical protein AB7F50_07005 [Fimbriimonadaceae bacterium]